MAQMLVLLLSLVLTVTAGETAGSNREVIHTARKSIDQVTQLQNARTAEKQGNTFSVSCGDSGTGTITALLGDRYNFELEEASLVVVSICAPDFETFLSTIVSVIIDPTATNNNFVTMADCIFGLSTRNVLKAGSHSFNPVWALVEDGSSADFSYELQCYPINPTATVQTKGSLDCKDTAEGDTTTDGSDITLTARFEDFYEFKQHETGPLTITTCSGDADPFVLVATVDDSGNLKATAWSTESVASDGEACESEGHGTLLQANVNQGSYYIIVEGTARDVEYTIDVGCAGAASGLTTAAVGLMTALITMMWGMN